MAQQGSEGGIHPKRRNEVHFWHAICSCGEGSRDWITSNWRAMADLSNAYVSAAPYPAEPVLKRACCGVPPVSGALTNLHLPLPPFHPQHRPNPEPGTGKLTGKGGKAADGVQTRIPPRALILMTTVDSFSFRGFPELGAPWGSERDTLMSPNRVAWGGNCRCCGTGRHLCAWTVTALLTVFFSKLEPASSAKQALAS